MAGKPTEADQGPVRVPVGEFRTHLGRFLERARAGEAVMLEERGRPVARLEVASRPLTAIEKVREMVRNGEAHWSGRRFEQPPAPLVLPAGFSLSELIIEERQHAADRFADGAHDSLPR